MANRFESLGANTRAGIHFLNQSIRSELRTFWRVIRFKENRDSAKPMKSAAAESNGKLVDDTKERATLADFHCLVC